MMASFSLIAHEKGFKFHAQPETGACSCLVLKGIAIGVKKIVKLYNL